MHHGTCGITSPPTAHDRGLSTPTTPKSGVASTLLTTIHTDTGRRVSDHLNITKLSHNRKTANDVIYTTQILLVLVFEPPGEPREVRSCQGFTLTQRLLAAGARAHTFLEVHRRCLTHYNRPGVAHMLRASTSPARRMPTLFALHSPRPAPLSASPNPTVPDLQKITRATTTPS